MAQLAAKARTGPIRQEQYRMKQLLWQAVGMAAVAPTIYGFLAWLSWWTPQVTP